MKNKFNIVIVGVGGQGIGMLSEILIRALDFSEIKVKGVDTHGLAQRGGSVISFLRTGEDIFSPLVKKNSADLIIALEMYEAYNALIDFAVPEKTVLVHYETSWQPLGVRLRKDNILKGSIIKDICLKNNIKEIPVIVENLPDPLMINMAILAEMIKRNTLKGLSLFSCETATKDLMNDSIYKKNIDFMYKYIDK